MAYCWTTARSRFRREIKKPTSSSSCLPTRARLELHWTYRIIAKAGGKELESGDVPINVFADDLVRRDLPSGSAARNW